MSRAALIATTASVLNRVPGSDRALDWVAGRHNWVAALFHHLAPGEDPLTAGLGVTFAPSAFDAWVAHCERRFTFVSLDDLRSGAAFAAPKPPLLLTFDDAYASVARIAAPKLASRGIPSVFFVNGRFLDNAHLALDNLLAAVIKLRGPEVLSPLLPEPKHSVDAILSHVVSRMTLTEREYFYSDVQAVSGLRAADLLERHQPYLTSEELRELPAMGMEIGNHTSSHVHTRILDAGGVASEIVENQAVLRALASRPIRAFAFPYGRCPDATPDVLRALGATGHEHVFLVRGRLNGDRLPGPSCRVSVHARSSRDAIGELELLPRLRALRERIGPASG